MRKIICGIIIALLVSSVFPLAFNVQPVKASDTIYIRADGSVDPPSAPILNVGNVSYTFTGNITDSIVVERDNIVVNGAGYVLEGAGTGWGIDLTGRSNVTIKNITIRKFDYGIILSSSSGNKLYANNITDNTSDGIYLCSSSNGNSISANTIANNYHGILLYSSSNNNSMSANNITNSTYCGICLDSSSGNSMSANNITNRNEFGICLSSSSSNSISANIITNNNVSIWLSSSSGNSISANNITNTTYDGICLCSSSGNSMSANTIANSYRGICLSSSSGNSMSANTITNSICGIWLYSSSGNSISANNITGNGDGIFLAYSSGNNISENTITNNLTNNLRGIYLYNSASNLICHNNFGDNTFQAYVTPGSVNIWDDGYPSGGNYWNDYAGTDANNDGIGDTPYIIDSNNTDHYPLMKPWAPVTDLASLVVRGQNNIIYYRTYNITTASWASWNALPGATCDSPAATVYGNELHIVVRGMDGNSLWHGYVNLIGGGFSGWTLLSGSTPSPPTLTANSTHLCLVVRGQNNLIYYRFHDCASQTWTGWTALPSGATCDGPAAVFLANKLHIVVRGMDGYSIWHSSVDLSTQAFSGWNLVGGATESKPTLTTCESRNEVILVVRGLNNVIYRNSWTGSSWAGWVGLPTGSTCDGVGATVVGETLHVVVRGMDGYTLWHGNVDLETGTFSDWTLLDGSTPSAPTLTS